MGEDAWPPYANSRGEGIGYEIIKAAFETVDVEVEFEVASFARITKKVMEGELIASFHVPYTPENQDEYLWPKTPLISSHSTWFFNKKSDILPTVLDQIPEGFRVGLVDGWYYTNRLKSRDGIMIEYAPTETSNIKKLIKEGLMETILWYVRSDEVKNMLDEIDTENMLQKGFEQHTQAPLHLAFSKSHPQSTMLIKKFEEGMKKITENDLYDELFYY